MRKFIKQFIPLFIITSIKEIKSKRYIKKLLNKKKSIYLEIGAGDKKGENDWITLDITRNCDIYWDLQKGIPFPNESIHKIYSSHLFEHFSFKEGQKLLDECLRVLVPGGSFSICVPNAKIYIEAYLRNQDLDSSTFFKHKSAFNNLSRIDYVNYVAYMGGYGNGEHHKYMFDEENLVAVLEKKGFKKVRLRGFDDTLDKQERNFDSIYAEAQK